MCSSQIIQRYSDIWVGHMHVKVNIRREYLFFEEQIFSHPMILVSRKISEYRSCPMVCSSSDHLLLIARQQKICSPNEKHSLYQQVHTRSLQNFEIFIYKCSHLNLSLNPSIFLFSILLEVSCIFFIVVKIRGIFLLHEMLEFVFQNVVWIGE